MMDVAKLRQQQGLKPQVKEVLDKEKEQQRERTQAHISKKQKKRQTTI